MAAWVVSVNLPSRQMDQAHQTKIQGLGDYVEVRIVVVDSTTLRAELGVVRKVLCASDRCRIWPRDESSVGNRVFAERRYHDYAWTDRRDAPAHGLP